MEDEVKERDRDRLRQLVLELTENGQALDLLPATKTDLADTLRQLGREAEAHHVEYGAGFSLGVEGGTTTVWIISGGRREPLMDLPEQGTP